MHPALGRQSHRPWPIPKRAWSWRQSWCDLLFAHWPVRAEILRPLVPPSLAIMEFDGSSWVGVVPFRMQGVMRRPLPDLPYFSAFPELNLRLYVERDGKPGVWFLSLDATNVFAVWAGRRWFHLPYHRARIHVRRRPGGVRYESIRRSKSAAPSFCASYGPSSEVVESRPGTLEHWLTERYCLYAQSPSGRLFRAEVHHRPWPLQRAQVAIDRNDLLAPHGIELADPPALAHFARRLDVLIWDPVELEG